MQAHFWLWLCLKRHNSHRQAIESHALVTTRTHELERIHETIVILHQLKQFVSAKTQLDAYLADNSDKGEVELSKYHFDTHFTLNRPAQLIFCCQNIERVGTLAAEPQTNGDHVRE